MLEVSRGKRPRIKGPCCAGYTLQRKFKGLHNSNTQIRASFSENGDYIICGSDDGSVYFWNTNGSAQAVPSHEESPPGLAPLQKSSSYESFQAHSDIATVAIFAPCGARRILGQPSARLSEKVFVYILQHA